ncbi:hypothetical protein [Burkholderia gladioli]|uniref:hypothetical protein n=1 Tax=Burkholderia gladioli TaxID=28095 RepID=UPI00163F8E6C|nr:hypothetical protein [Burkholderia gladioli]
MFSGFPPTCDTPLQSQYDQHAFNTIKESNHIHQGLKPETVRSLVARAHEVVGRLEKARVSLAENLLAVRASMPSPPTSGLVGSAPSQVHGEALDSLLLLIVNLEGEAAHIEQLNREIRI